MTDWSTRSGGSRTGVSAPLEPVRTIRLHESVIESILKRLDQTDSGSTRPACAAERHRFRTKAIIVGMQQPGDASMKSFLCPTRNVSRTGLSCLHGGYVHVRTRCTIQLTTQHGTLYPVPGTVVRCSLVERNIHEVGIQFEMEVDPELFCEDEEQVRVLIVEPNEEACQSLVHRLEMGNARVRRIAKVEELLNAVDREEHDLLLLDADGAGGGNMPAVKVIRSRGFKGAIIGLTSQADEATSRRITATGCLRPLIKGAGDVEIKAVLDAAKQHRRTQGLGGNDAMAGLIAGFVADLPKRQRDIQMAMRRDDSAGLQSALSSLAEAAGSHGFKALGEAASKIENALKDGGTVAGIRSDIADLIKLCARVRA